MKLWKYLAGEAFLAEVFFWRLRRSTENEKLNEEIRNFCTEYDKGNFIIPIIKKDVTKE